MAKKTRSAKRTKRKAFEPPLTAEPDSELRFEFTDAVRRDPETVRRLAHRAVDLVVDSGCHKLLCTVVADSLAYITRDQCIKNMSDFVHEACVDQKEAADG